MKLNALLVDGSALFHTSRLVGDGKPLDYRRLDDLLRRHLEIDAFDLKLFFTAVDPANEGQQKFLGFIHDGMKWDVDAVPVPEAIVPPSTVTTYEANQPRSYIRFDARIAFSLGRLVGSYAKAVVISDSYPLARPIHETAARGTGVVLAYFRQCIDPRWNKLLREPSRDNRTKPKVTDKIEFIDLDKHIDDLFGLFPRSGVGEAGVSGLRRLP